jgi:hypothetical protein
MSTYEKGLQLACLIAEWLKPIDKRARPTKGSGNKGQVADVNNKYFIIEAKNWDVGNIIIDKGIWDKLLSEVPSSSQRLPMLVQQNAQGDIVVSMRIQDIFSIIYQAYPKDE